MSSSTDDDQSLIEKFLNLRRAQKDGEYAPHKPLLLLLALGRFQRGQQGPVPFGEIEGELRELLRKFGAPRDNYQAELPFWHLQNDGLWEVLGGKAFQPRKGDSSPSVTELRRLSGGFPKAIASRLRGRPDLVRQIGHALLDKYFPSLRHNGLLAAVNLDLSALPQEKRVMASRLGRPYWAFISNPLIYRTLDSLRAFDEEVWTVTRGAIEVGDRAIIWQSKDKSGRRGIVALGEVLTPPTLMELPPQFLPYWLKPEPWDKLMHRVWIRYARPSKCPRWMREDGTDPVLEALSVTRARGGGVYRLTPEQWEAVLEEVGGWPKETRAPRPLPSDDWQVAVEGNRARNKGQGFSSSPEVRRAVENLAMDRAEAHFVEQRYKVERRGKPYDLLCTREDSTLYVEVKGTQTDGTEVLLTPNEVVFAREYKETMALFVLHSVSIESVDGKVQASGGTVRILQPWDPDAGKLEPVGFVCTLP